jgi:hypothetical protein
MTRRWLAVVSAALLLAASAWPAQAASDPELAGTYLSKGLNPDGTEYHGVVRIARHGESFIVSWMTTLARDRSVMLVPTSVGIGVVSGGMLAVSYYSAQTAGVVLYQIEQDGARLAGSWAVAGDNGTVYAETLTKVAESDLPAPEAPSDHERQPAPRRPALPRADRSL